MNNCKPDVIIRKYALRKPHCTHVCGQIVFAEYTIRCSSHVTYRCIVSLRAQSMLKAPYTRKTNTNAGEKCLRMIHSQPITIGIVENIHVYARRWRAQVHTINVHSYVHT